MKEAAIQRVILDYLTATGVLAFRMNTGAVKIDKRFMRFGSPGMADILAFPRRLSGRGIEIAGYSSPLWIECKGETGVQSALQRSFQAMVQEYGHKYILARSLDDVIAAVE